MRIIITKSKFKNKSINENRESLKFLAKDSKIDKILEVTNPNGEPIKTFDLAPDDIEKLEEVSKMRNVSTKEYIDITVGQLVEASNIINDAIEKLGGEPTTVNEKNDDSIKVGDRFFSTTANQWYEVVKKGRFANVYVKFDNDNKIIRTETYACKQCRLVPDSRNRRPENIIRLPQSGRIVPTTEQITQLNGIVHFTKEFAQIMHITRDNQKQPLNPKFYFKGYNKYDIIDVDSKGIRVMMNVAKNETMKISWFKLLANKESAVFEIDGFVKKSISIFDLLDDATLLNDLVMVLFELVNNCTSTYTLSAMLHVFEELNGNEYKPPRQPIELSQIIRANRFPDSKTLKNMYKLLFTKALQWYRCGFIQDYAKLETLISKLAVAIAMKNFSSDFYDALRDEAKKLNVPI